MENQNTPPLPIPGAAPVPGMWNPGQSGPQAMSTAPQNTWQMLVDSAPLHAEAQYYQRGTSVGLPVATRSSLRTGELQFTEEGISVRGMEVRVPAYLKIVSGVLIVLFYVLRITGSAMRGSHSSNVWIVLAATVGVALILVILGIVNERRRFPVEITIPWQSVHGALIENNFKWITLVLEQPSDKPRKKPLYHFLSLGKLEPQMVTGIADTVAHFAPHAKFKRSNFKEYVLGTKIAIITAIVFVVGFLGWLLFTLLKKF